MEGLDRERGKKEEIEIKGKEGGVFLGCIVQGVWLPFYLHVGGLPVHLRIKPKPRSRPMPSHLMYRGQFL